MTSKSTKRIAVVAAVTASAAVLSSLAGAASSSPTTVPLSYAPDSLAVYSSSGERMGTLTGSGLNTEFVSSSGQRAR